MKAAARAAWAVSPVLTAGLIHVAVLKLDLGGRLAVPLDAGGCWRGRRLLGPNKTWRGLLLMPLATAVAFRCQAHLERRYPRLGSISVWGSTPPGGAWGAGALLGFAYVAAELPNSFVKRRLGIPAGGRARRLGGAVQYLVDQGDSVAGCLLALRLLTAPPASLLMSAAALGIAVHAGVDLLMVGIGVRRRS